MGHNAIACSSHTVVWLLLFLPSGLCGQQELVAGTPLPFECSRTLPASFRLALKSGTVAHVRMEQSEGDLVAVIADPFGTRRVLDEFDFGSETFTIVARVVGEYRIAVTPAARVFGVAKGAIVLTSVTSLRAEDEANVTAEDLATRSKESVHDGSDITRAVALARSSLREWSQMPDLFSVARTSLRMGEIFYAHGEYLQAREAFREAAGVCTQAGDQRCQAEAANNLGLVALSLVDIEEALSHFEIAGAAWHRLGMTFGEAVTRSNLGMLYRQTGEWQKALDEYQRAGQLFQRSNPLSVARVTNNLGMVYMSMAEYDRAASYFSKALAMSPAAKAPQREVGRFRLNLGRAHLLAGRLSQALREEQQALATLKLAADTSGIADVYNSLGQIQLKMKQPLAAEASLRTSQSLYTEIGNQRGLASALHYLGVLSTGAANFAQARALLAQALEIRNQGRLRDEAAESLYRLAVAEHEEGEVEEAVQHLEQAIALTESLRANVESEPLRRTYFAEKQTYTEYLVTILMSHRTASDSDRLARRAFAVVERVRARALVEGMSSGRIAGQAAPDPALTARQQSIRRRLNFKSAQLAAYVQNKSNSSAETTLRAEVDGLLAEDAEVDASIRKANPKFESLTGAPPLGVDEVQDRLLGERDLLVEYFLGEPQSYVWVIGRHFFDVRDLPPRSRIELRARTVLGALDDVEERKADPRKRAHFIAAIRQLSEVVGLPFGVERGGGRILIVPDGILHRVPFAALVADNSKGVSYPDNALGLQREFVQTPSASVFRILRERRKTAARMPLHVTALVDPVFDRTDSRVEARALQRRDFRTVTKGPEGLDLPRLPFAEEELAPVLRYVPPAARTILRDLQSTREAFLDPRTWRSSLVLASTHAFADDLQPELSSIVFSMTAKDGRAVDGMVRLYDIYDLTVASSLVILSACETAQGRQVRGEGLVGISRGFLFAGASALLAPLNRVDAEASATLVAGVLENVLGPSGMATSGALLQARIALAKSGRWKDPYYWSSFVLISAWDAD